MLLPVASDIPVHPICHFTIRNAGALYVILNGEKPEPIKDPFCANETSDFDSILDKGGNQLAIWLVKNLNIEKKPE